MTSLGERTSALDVFFGADYAPFYERVQLPQRAEREADLLVRLLELSPGAKVLDAACAYGRIGTRIARRGMWVVGVDLNESALARARELATALQVADRTRFFRADLRTFLRPAAFDAAVCWFSSFGYFSEADDQRILQNLAESLTPGGRLALEVLDQEAVANTLRADRSLPVIVSEIDDTNAIVDRIRLDEAGRGIVVNRVLERSDALARGTLRVRSFAFEELRDWLLAVGFTEAVRHRPAPDEADLFTQWSLIVTATR